MVQLAAEQLLQLALAVSCGATAIVAVVFLFVVRTTRRRGAAWFWGWAFLAVTFGVEALAQYDPVHLVPLGLAAVLAAAASAWLGAAGASSFRQDGSVPQWARVFIASATAAGLLFTLTDYAGACLVAVELVLLSSLVVQAAVLLPLCRRGRLSGLQTACFAQILLSIFLLRTIVSAVVLYARGEELNSLYWTIEVVGGTIFAFVLAMGEVIALIDGVRAELQEANEALSQAMDGLEVAAKLDPLTGLQNRYAFYMMVDEVKQRGALGGSIAIIDLNSLKRINDTFGHHAGDRALLNVANRLQDIVRQSDSVFRWGGDEFVALLFGMQPDLARERLTHMRPPDPLEVPEHGTVPLSVSWGVAPLQNDVEAALRDADVQLYSQKRLLSHAAQQEAKT